MSTAPPRSWGVILMVIHVTDPGSVRHVLSKGVVDQNRAVGGIADHHDPLSGAAQIPQWSNVHKK